MLLISTTSRSTDDDTPRVLFFLAYLGGFLGILWQGLWFFVAAFHQKWPISSTSNVTVYFVLQAVFLGFMSQLGAICLVRRSGTRPKLLEEYSRINNLDCHNENDDEEQVGSAS
jgi:hypothetical protein